MSNNREDLLKKPLLNFYKNKDNLSKFANVIEKKSKYSLRVIEWFCNNYSKKYDIIYKNSDGKDFNVYLSYKSQLDSYQKKQFDPFKRQHTGFETFELKYESDSKIKNITTTVGQLNFFRWCIKNDVLEYIKKNIKHIKNDMISSVRYNTLELKNSKKNTDDNGNNNQTSTQRKKRQPLSVSATRTFIKKYKKVVLEFD